MGDGLVTVALGVGAFSSVAETPSLIFSTAS